MLTIRNEQMQAFRKAGLERFATRLTTKFAAVWPERASQLGDLVGQIVNLRPIGNRPPGLWVGHRRAGFQMQELDPKNMDLRICATRKLVDCVDRSWEPLLRSAKLPNGVTRIRYSIKDARLAGGLRIVL